MRPGSSNPVVFTWMHTLVGATHHYHIASNQNSPAGEPGLPWAGATVNETAAANATPELRALEQQARSTRVGIWSGRGDDDD
jgi:hypothetical protein